MVWKNFQSRLITDNTSATPAKTNEPFSPTTSEKVGMDFLKKNFYRRKLTPPPTIHILL